jgi:hypothetical protein
LLEIGVNILIKQNLDKRETNRVLFNILKTFKNPFTYM